MQPSYGSVSVSWPLLRLARLLCRRRQGSDVPITASSNVTQQSISSAGVAAILSGTAMAGYASQVLQYASSYGIDSNFFLSYCQWENGFLEAGTLDAQGNNPLGTTCEEGGPPEHFGIDCIQYPGNPLWFNTYPDIPTGIKGGYDWAAEWAPQAGNQWGQLLCIALCGPCQCAGDSFQTNVLSSGSQNANAYPPTGGQPPPNCPCGADPSTGLCLDCSMMGANANAIVLVLGFVAVGAAAYATWRYAHG